MRRTETGKIRIFAVQLRECTGLEMKVQRRASLPLAKHHEEMFVDCATKFFYELATAASALDEPIDVLTAPAVYHRALRAHVSASWPTFG
jgi:hypothetical protein